jgi:acyl carrier protein
MADCGFENVDLEIICAHNILTGDEMFLKSEGVGIPAQLVKDGFLESCILDTLALRWHKVLNTKKHSIFRQLFVCSGTKIEGAKRVNTQEQEASEHTENLVVERKSRDISRQAILDYLAQLMVSVTKLDPSIVQEATLINDLGLDSLGAVEVISTLDEEWAITLSLMDFFEGQSIAQVVDKIVQLLTEKPGDGGSDIDQMVVSAHFESVKNKSVIEWEEGEIL